MKRGGQVIYMGPLGPRSHKVVEYFEVSSEVLLWLIETSAFNLPKNIKDFMKKYE